MPKLLGLQRTYNEFVDEENRARSRTLQGLRNKLKMNIEEVKPTVLKDITEEADFMNYSDLLSRSSSVLAQQATRTALKLSEEEPIGVVRTNPFRDNEEFTKLISYFNRLQAIIQKQFKAGKVSETDIENIRKLFLQNGTIANLENIRTAFNQMSLIIPAITEQAEIIDRVYKSVDSGLYIKVQFPTSFKLLVEPLTRTEEEELKPSPPDLPVPRPSEDVPMPDLPAGMPPPAPPAPEGVEEIRAGLTKADYIRSIKEILGRAPNALVRGKSRQILTRIGKIDDLDLLEQFKMNLNELVGTPEYKDATQTRKGELIDELLRIVGDGRGFGVGLGRGFGVGLGRGFGVGLGACGSGRFGYPSNSRFTPLTLYNDEGQNIYALRKFES